METGEKDTKRVGKGVVLPASELANQRPQIRILDIRVFFHLISLLNNTVFYYNNQNSRNTIFLDVDGSSCSDWYFLAYGMCC